MASGSVTENEVLELLRAALETHRNDGGYTSAEIAGILDCGDKKARAVIKVLTATGKLVPGKRTVARIDGTSQPVPVYRLA